MKNILFLIEYFLISVLGKIVLLLGFKKSKKLGKILGRAAFKYITNLRNYAINNAKVIFGNVDKNILKTLERSFENIGIFITDSFFLENINTENYKNFVEFEDFNNIEKALNEKRGVIVVTGHFGNWEFLAGVPSKLGLVNVAVVMNRQINPFTEKMILKMRKRAKLETIYNTPEEIKKIISFLKNGWIVGMVVDQAYYFDPIYVEFFGKEAPTARGPAVFHLKLKSPIVMARSILMNDGRYKLKFYEPLKFDLPYNNESIKYIMKYINGIFEEWIKEDPTQWFSWTHPRWDVEGIVTRKKINSKPN